MTITRDQALALVHEYTQSEPLRRHMYAVELSMRALAEQYGENADDWGLVGLLHDFDYERFPNAQHSATDEHPAEGVRILAAPRPARRDAAGDPGARHVHRSAAGHPDGPGPVRGR